MQLPCTVFEDFPQVLSTALQATLTDPSIFKVVVAEFSPGIAELQLLQRAPRWDASNGGAGGADGSGGSSTGGRSRARGRSEVVLRLGLQRSDDEVIREHATTFAVKV